MQPLLPGYEHDIEYGAGLSAGAGAHKVVIHTTESPNGSYEAVRNLWRGPNNWGKGLPHFLADGARYVQLLPLNVGAYTLENSPGGADTNRSGPAIQVEICTYAADGLNDLEIEALSHWLADLVNAGVDLDLSQHPTFYGTDAGFTLASYTARQRMSGDAYQAFNGFCGHQHVPENAHWDPGKLDGLRVERLARMYLGQPPTEPGEDEMTEDDRRWIAETLKGERNHMYAALDQRAAAIIEAVIRVDEDDEKIITQKRDELLAVVLPQLDRIEKAG